LLQIVQRYNDSKLDVLTFNQVHWLVLLRKIEIFSFCMLFWCCKSVSAYNLHSYCA
jgi:hypothetical protein